jgi:hypothetical protein
MYLLVLNSFRAIKLLTDYYATAWNITASSVNAL